MVIGPCRRECGTVPRLGSARWTIIRASAHWRHRLWPPSTRLCAARAKKPPLASLRIGAKFPRVGALHAALAQESKMDIVRLAALTTAAVLAAAPITAQADSYWEVEAAR